MVWLPRRNPTGERTRCLIGEIEGDAGGDRFRFAGRLKVQLDDEIAVALEAPRHAVGRRPRTLTGRPAEQMAGRIRRFRRHRAAVSRLRVLRVEPARRARCDRRRGRRGAPRGHCPDGTPPHCTWRAAVVGIGSTKVRNTSGPSARSRYASGMATTRSGVPNCQPAVHVGMAGRSRGSPSGAPWATHCWIVSISAAVSTRASAKSPLPGSGFHGGMTRRRVASAICVRCWRTSR